MEKWRKKGDRCNQEVARTKTNYHSRKPPTGMPYWEKQFVCSIGSMSWKKFLEAKEFTHLYDDIMKWDDCAGEEAFRAAKDRFYAKFHGLSYDDKSHDPDLYIDKIDWNAEMDHNLVEDLESEPVGLDEGSPREPVVIFGDVLPDPYKDYSPYGWGDSDEKVKNSWGISDEIKKDESGINWDDYIQNGRVIWDNCEAGGGNDWWDWTENGNKAGDEGWNANTNDDNYNHNYNYDGYGYNNVDGKRHMQSQKTWRYHGNGNQRRSNGNWRKSAGQSYESQRGHGSSFRAYGGQRIHVHQ